MQYLSTVLVFLPLPFSLSSPGLPMALTLNTPPTKTSPPPSLFSSLSVIPGLSISAQGTVGKLCVSALPNNYLQLRLTAVWPIVKGLAIRSTPPPNPPLALSVLECGQTLCENDPNSPLLTLHTPQLTLREPAPQPACLSSALTSFTLPLLSLHPSSLLPCLAPTPASVPSSQLSFRGLRSHWDLILFVVLWMVQGQHRQWIFWDEQLLCDLGFTTANR